MERRSFVRSLLGLPVAIAAGIMGFGKVSSAAIVFPAAPETWGVITHFAISSASDVIFITDKQAQVAIDDAWKRRDSSRKGKS